MVNPKLRQFQAIDDSHMVDNLVHQIMCNAMELCLIILKSNSKLCYRDLGARFFGMLQDFVLKPDLDEVIGL